MNNTTHASDIHPIEFFLACLINLIEFTCYLINEIAGHHQTTTNIVSGDQTTTTTPTPTKTTTPATPQINPLLTHLQSLTVKQLQAFTSIKSSKYNKEALIAIAAVG